MNHKSKDPSLSPFSCSYTPQVPELLYKLGCTIAISTYQAGKLLFFSAPDENSIVQLPRTFPKPMGIAEDATSNMLALAVKNSVIVFRNSEELAAHYPKSPGTYDALFLPRATYHTGSLDIHDLRIGGDGRLYAVNTLFSCISVIDDQFNFTPYWSPPFIDKLASEDRCHLNGMAMQDGLPAYASMFGQGNSTRSWTSSPATTGTIYHIPTGETVAHDLAMPNSPRLFDCQLYVLLSATGELSKIDLDTGHAEAIVRLDGFVRGMSICGDHLFVGLSKIREKSSSFGKLDIAGKSKNAGVVIVHLPTGTVVGRIFYNTSVDEIYDVHILEGMRRPNILNTISEDHNDALMTPEATYWAKKGRKLS